MDDDQRKQHESENLRKLKPYLNVSVLIFLILWVLTFFLPLKCIKSGGYYHVLALFGGDNTRFEPYMYSYKSGFEEFYCILMQFFFVLSLVILAQAKNKRQIIFSRTSAILNLFSFPFIYIGINFYGYKFKLWSAPQVIFPYTGFYILWAIGFILLIFLILLKVKIEKA